MTPKRRMNVLAFVFVLSFSVVLAACGPALGSVPEGQGSTPIQTATPMPTITPRPTATPIPQSAPQAPGQGLVIPSTPNTPFTLEVTEQQINEYLAGQAYEQDGASLRDVRVTITDDEIIAQGHGAYQPLGLDSPVTARGVPVVADGKVYVQVRDVALDPSVPAFTRFLAELAIEQALRRYSTPQGIEIQTGDTQITGVDLQPGRIIIFGITGQGGVRGA